MRLAFLLLSAAFLWVGTCSATTYVVRPDGTGDFPTIQAAINAAVDGDVIELTDGTFHGEGNRDLDYLGKGITVGSQSGSPELCVIDCDGTPTQPHRGFHFHSGESEGAVLEGVTVTDGHVAGSGGTPEDWGGAVLCHYASPTIRDCVFRENTAGDSGGGLLAWYCAPVISGCTFAYNSAQWGGGMVAYASPATVTDCSFRENSASLNGGGLYDSLVGSTVMGTTFEGNTSANRGGGMACNDSASRVAWCTFYANRADDGGAGVWLLEGADVRFENTIVSFSTSGDGIRCWEPATPHLVCCDVYGNEGGDWAGCIEDQLGLEGNIAADPLFCDPLSGDLTLHANSPCAPGQACDLIGAWPVGCGPTAATPTTWGAVKAMFRDATR